MKKNTRTLFTSALLAFATTLHCQAQEISQHTQMELRTTTMPDLTKAPVSLAELVVQIHNHTDLSVRVATNVYTQDFTVITPVLITDVQSLGAMLENFTQATGLCWRIVGDRTIEIYRDNTLLAKSGVKQ